MRTSLIYCVSGDVLGSYANFNLSLNNLHILELGGKFLKKMWCCVGGGVYQDNLVSSTELIM